MIDAEKVIEAFLENWDGPTAEPLWCLADALREIAQGIQSEGFYQGEAEQARFELADEIHEVADEIELNATKQ